MNVSDMTTLAANELIADAERVQNEQAEFCQAPRSVWDNCPRACSGDCIHYNAQ